MTMTILNLALSTLPQEKNNVSDIAGALKLFPV